MNIEFPHFLILYLPKSMGSNFDRINVWSFKYKECFLYSDFLTRQFLTINNKKNRRFEFLYIFACLIGIRSLKSSDPFFFFLWIRSGSGFKRMLDLIFLKGLIRIRILLKFEDVLFSLSGKDTKLTA